MNHSGFGPMRPQRVEEKYRQAYAQAGFDLNARGKVLPQIKPAAQPPGFSKLPEPTRTPTKTSPPAIRAQVATYEEIPARLRPVYELSPLGRYEPNAVGAALGAYRSALTKDPHREPVAPLRKLSRQEWSLLLSVSEPGKERAYFLRSLVVSKRIKPKD